MNLPGNLIDLNHIFKIEDSFYGWKAYGNDSVEFVGYNTIKKAFDFGPSYPEISGEISNSAHKNSLLYVPLETNNECLVAEVLKMQVQDSSIYILDKKQDQLLKFNK